MRKKLFPNLVICLFIGLSGNAAYAQSSPAKKALVARILKAQQPGIESMGRNMAERPAVALLDRAGAVLQEKVAADKRDAVGKDIQADVRKYLEEAAPLVANRAVRLAPTTVGPFLEETFTEEELKQIAGFLESPAFNKYQQATGEMQKLLLEKVVADTRGSVEPKLVALEQTVSKRLGIAPSAPSGAVK